MKKLFRLLAILLVLSLCGCAAETPENHQITQLVYNGNPMVYTDTVYGLSVELPIVERMYISMDRPSIFEGSEKYEFTAPGSFLILRKRNPKNGEIIFYMHICAMNTTTTYRIFHISDALYTDLTTGSGLSGRVQETQIEPRESELSTATDEDDNIAYIYHELYGAGYMFEVNFKECGHYASTFIHEDFRDEYYPLMMEILLSLEAF